MNISVCMIGKNEEKVVGQCLEAIAKYDLEIIYTDTGSTDRTKEIVIGYTQKIYDFVWCDDFSAARNFCASKATNDWVLCIDCDEVLQPLDIKELDRWLRNADGCVGAICQKNLVPASEDQGEYCLNCLQARLYNRKQYKYKYRIHEQLVPIGEGCEPTALEAPIEVLHKGYVAAGSEVFEAKRKRNITLLGKALKEQADSEDIAFFYYQLGQSYNGFDNAKAMECFEESAKRTGLVNKGYLISLVTDYGYLLVENGMLEKALYLVWPYKELLSNYSDYNYLVAVIFVKLGGYENAREFLVKAMGASKCIDARTKEELPKHYLEVLDKMVSLTRK